MMAETALNEQANRSLVFKDGYDTVKLSFDDINYVEGDGNYIHIYGIRKKYTLRNSLEWFKQNVPVDMFQQTQRSYIVNVTKITKTSSKSVFINNTEIPLSRNYTFKLD